MASAVCCGHAANPSTASPCLPPRTSRQACVLLPAAMLRGSRRLLHGPCLHPRAAICAAGKRADSARSQTAWVKVAAAAAQRVGRGSSSVAPISLPWASEERGPKAVRRVRLGRSPQVTCVASPVSDGAHAAGLPRPSPGPQRRSSVLSPLPVSPLASLPHDSLRSVG